MDDTPLGFLWFAFLLTKSNSPCRAIEYIIQRPSEEPALLKSGLGGNHALCCYRSVVLNVSFMRNGCKERFSCSTGLLSFCFLLLPDKTGKKAFFMDIAFLYELWQVFIEIRDRYKLLQFPWRSIRGQSILYCVHTSHIGNIRGPLCLKEDHSNNK